MRKFPLKKFLIHLLQHFLAIGIFLAVAGLLLHSYVSVNSIDGTRVYKLLTTISSDEFEESEIYHDLFQNTVSDITQLVAISGQLETNGKFDPLKRINISDYAAKIDQNSKCDIAVDYELDKLIRWGKYGIEYTKKTMSLDEFVNYFGDCIFPENFTVSEYDELKFDGFYRMGKNTLNTGEIPIGPNGEYNNEPPAYYGKSVEEVTAITEKMEKSGYTKTQLEGLVLSYIVENNPDGLDLISENDRMKIEVTLLRERYGSLNDDEKLMQIADNWLDFLNLQHNLIASIESLSLNYQRYQICNAEYGEGKSNVKYVVRMMTDEGLCTYTNMSEMKNSSDDEITEVFSAYQKYLIYYPDSLVFMGNTIVSEEEFYEYVKVYEYAYPETTHIWLGVDTAYAVEGDTFYNAAKLYEKIVPIAGRYVALGISLIFCWLATVIYLSVVAGVKVSSTGKKEWKLSAFDRIWTELLVLLAILFVIGAKMGFDDLVQVAEYSNMLVSDKIGTEQRVLIIYQYSVFALYGVYLSVGFSIVWYSAVRRYKCDNLWTASLLCKISKGFQAVLRFMTRHRNSMISSLLSYNMYLFINAAAIFTAYEFREEEKIPLYIFVGIILFNGGIGVILFRNNAERNEILDGMNRIRDGEVDFKLDVDSLHGENRYLAEAVNRIGDGIDKAVKTSMKDEKMKTDLITNVSHDIKTPLTSIINYIDLLKHLEIKEEPAKGYIDILDNKAHRLKQLTDDLVEASKISSGNITLNMEKINLTELVNQGIGEFSDKLEDSELEVVFTGTEKPAYIYADSRHMWRVLENLLNNICKYALTGTRVYIEIQNEEEIVSLSVKNISRQQMNISPDELTERFIRGDSARSTEGSGLGLSIAKNLIRAQKGEFNIYLDGDLFKVVLKFAGYSDSNMGSI